MPPHITRNTEIVLDNGAVTTQTRYDPKENRHYARCDICHIVEVKLPPTANPHNLKIYRAACKQLQQHKCTSTNSTLFIDKGATAGGQIKTTVSMHGTSIRRQRSTNATPLDVSYSCPGQWVHWSAGSLWETYPFQLHPSVIRRGTSNYLEVQCINACSART